MTHNKLILITLNIGIIVTLIGGGLSVNATEQGTIDNLIALTVFPATILLLVAAAMLATVEVVKETITQANPNQVHLS